jgi:hypothetical protein
VRSKVGEGSVFTMELPIARDRGAVPDGNPPPAAATA